MPAITPEQASSAELVHLTNVLNNNENKINKLLETGERIYSCGELRSKEIAVIKQHYEEAGWEVQVTQDPQTGLRFLKFAARSK